MPPLPSTINRRVQTRQPSRRVQQRQRRQRNHHGTHRAAPHFDEGGQQTQQSSQRFGTALTSRLATYSRPDKFQPARPPDDKQSPKPSGRPPDGERSHELRDWISKTLEGQLAVLQLRRPRRETPMAEEATKNSRPRARGRVGTSAGTLHHPAR